MNTQWNPVERLVEDETYTMADLRRLDPTGSLAHQARRQLDDLTGLVARTHDRLQADAPPVPVESEEDVPAAPRRRPGLGALGDRLAPAQDGPP